ncbi:cell division protein FtsQ/DivIB [Leptolyngbya sp. AN02str]|uniref:cell division protein FtsQ/DivIB n=1 Tax=Leptolyngbya sp. AN02str TaxID=3423363 RepID=UPI003D316F4E
MANLPYVSRNELIQRRRRLRWQRRLKAAQSFWRLIVLLGLTGGAVWVMRQPGWVIRDASQIVVEGYELLSPEMVRSLLPLEYPQSLWEVEVDQVAQELASRGPVSAATISRRLFPPSLVVEITERTPVAIALDFVPDVTSPTGAIATNPSRGLIDATGAWFPLENYTTISPSLQIPNLTVVGMHAQNREQWATLYQELSRFQQTVANPVTISELDWRDPTNLIARTEVGSVHLGAFSNAQMFAQQLQALNQMRQLPQNINTSRIAYIDLKNPASPLIQMVGFHQAVSYENPNATSADGDSDYYNDDEF